MGTRAVLGILVKPLGSLWRWWQSLGRVRNLVLFLLTILTTYLVGGPVYSATLMTILLAHELGHFLMSRKYHIPASLPFFIPLPFPPFGTLGAIIKARKRWTNRRTLFDIAVAGPLAGFFFTVPAIILGLKQSTVLPLSEITMTTFRLGDSILFLALARVTLGAVPEGFEIILHPVAYAGWIGLYVMALNLLPIGQLDGGHVIYALIGERSRLAYLAVLGLFALMAWHFFRPWFFLIGLILILGMTKHPAPKDDQTPLDLKRKLMGVFMLILFILSFTPVPFPDLF